MSNEDTPVQTDGNSTPSEFDALDFANESQTTGDPKLDDKISKMLEKTLQEEGIPLPSDDSAEPESSPEVSEEPDEELTPSDDDSSIEVAEDEAPEAETAQDDEYDVFDYEDLKKGRIPIKNSDTGDIEYKTIDQINAEVNRSRKQAEALNEVETRTAELNAREQRFEQDTFTQQQMQAELIGNQQIEAMKRTAAVHQEKINEFLAKGDSHGAMIEQGKLNQLAQQAREVQANVKEAQANIQQARDKAADDAVTELSKFGLGELATDTQLQEAFKEYAFKHIPESVIGVVNTNSALLAMVEKARRWDKANSERPKPMIKTSGKKTIKGSAAQVSKPKTAPKQGTDAKVDDMFAKYGV